MRACFLALMSLVFLCFFVLPAAGQAGAEKKKDVPPQKQPENITADTDINGKTLDQWIALISSSDRSQTEAAIKSILLYGPELAQRAMPAMIAELNKHSPPTYKLDLSVRVNVPPALSIIISSLQNPDPELSAYAVAAIRKMLTDPQIIVKFRATQSLAQMGPTARSTFKDIIPLTLGGDTWETRHAAVLALGSVAFDPKAAPPKEVVDTLFNSMDKDKESALKVRLAALQSLDVLRVGQVPALKAGFQTRLQKMADKDPDPVCRLRAHAMVFPLLTTVPEKKKRLDAIASFLDYTDAHVRMETTQALGYIGVEAKDQVPRLLKALRDKDLTVMGWAMWALGNIKDKSALAPLQEIANDSKVSQPYRDTAKEAIDSINGIPAKKKDDTKKGSRL